MKTIALHIIAPLLAATTLFARVLPPPTEPPAESRMSDWLNGKYLTGNWGGLRDRLEASGVDIFAYYTTDPAGNVTGGKSRDFNYADDFFFGVNFDLQKLIGWSGGHFTINAINRDGSSIGENVGSQFNPQQTVGGQSIFLYDVFLEQKFFEDRFSIKAGRFGACDDFNSSPIYGFYMNNGIDGDIRNVLFDTQFSAYPFATWAARVRIDPTPEFNAEVGVFQTTPDVFDRDNHGVKWDIQSDDGTFLIAQIGWTPELFKRAVQNDKTADGKSVSAPEMKGLPGHYWIGGSLSPWKGYSQFGRVEKTQNSYGFYVHGDQMVYQEKPGSDQGLTVWAASGYYPQENISIMPFQVNSGLIYKGLLPSRDNDREILGVMYGRFSRDYARTVRASGAGDPRYELVVEAAHRFQIARFAYIQPDVQVIVRPGGTGNIPNALVLGAQMGITF